MPLNPTSTRTAQKNTWGGFQTATMYSGAVVPNLAGAPNAVATGSDVLLCSGPGRLDSITLNPPFSSGLNLAIIFYDSAIPTSGGPIATSGMKIVGYTPAVVALVSGYSPVSGNTAVAGALDLMAGVPRQVSVPFQSGLCFNSRSGQCGFTAAWTPEQPLQ
jgi:hypothetical protein